MNSQLAVRVALIGTLALVLFAVIFLRLWFLQVLTGSQYVAQAKTNITRKVSVAAPRGRILASDGTTPLVGSVNVPAILIEPQSLPVQVQASFTGVNDAHPDQVIYTRLERALGMSTKLSPCQYSLTVDNRQGVLVRNKHFDQQLSEVACIVAQHAADITNGSITIATNVPVAEQAFISERQAQFSGVEVSQVSVSTYPQGQLAAQLLGTVGSNSNAATGKALFTAVPDYDDVGQTGLENEYNTFLQGTDGYARVQVNAQGTYQGTSTPKAPVSGDDLKTSINLALEKVGTESLARSISENGGNDGGAFVAMDPENGQIDAMGSLPSYDPSVFTKPLTQQKYNRLFADNPEDPLFDRATQAVGPDGSTFKVITATAALQSGQWTPDKLYDDTGEVCPTPSDPASCMHNAPGEGGAGAIDMETAFELSDDDFFYNLGGVLNVQNPLKEPQGAALQEWAKKFGIGQTPNLDVPYASAGTDPSPGYVATKIADETACDTGSGAYRYYRVINKVDEFSSTPKSGYVKTPRRPAGYCGIAELPNAGWTVGDNMHEAIGQGDVQASPLQVAMVYSAIANGGTLVSPHVGEDIQSPTGNVIQKINPAPERKLDISPTNLATIQQGLALAANGTSGTSYDVMHTFKPTVYGKTGTADYEPTSGPDAGVDTAYAWYACYVPATETSKPITVVVWVEDGGYGDVAAAPVARQILSQWFYGTPGPYAQGTSTDQ